MHQVAEKGALPSLVNLSAQRSPDHDLRGVILHCIAALSVNTGLRDEIMAEGALPVLCRTAKLRVTSLQLPVAAALANLCSSAGPSHPLFSAVECLAALEVLSQSSNAEVQASNFFLWLDASCYTSQASSPLKMAHGPPLSALLLVWNMMDCPTSQCATEARCSGRLASRSCK